MGLTKLSPTQRLGAVILGFLCTGGAIVSAFFITQLFLQAQASARWPTVSGTLTKARVSGHYIADVSYRYDVGGITYTGTKIRASDGQYSDEGEAAQAIQGLSPEQVVQVSYNPANPTQSFLRPGAGAPEYAMLCIPFIMFGVGAFLLWFTWRAR